MSDIKKSDKWMGRLGILQALFLLFVSYSIIGIVIDLQDEFNDLAEETVCSPWAGCSVEEEKELSDFVDLIQGKIVMWQAAWGFVFFVGLYFFYISFRLGTGKDRWVPFRGLVSSKVPALKLSDRQLFIYTVLATSLILFIVGFIEASGINAIIDEINEFDSDVDDIEKQDFATVNGSVVGYCNTAFLFLILIIAFFSRDKPGIEESKTAENMLNLEGDSSDIGNDDSLELAITSEEKTDEE